MADAAAESPSAGDQSSSAAAANLGLPQALEEALANSAEVDRLMAERQAEMEKTSNDNEVWRG